MGTSLNLEVDTELTQRKHTLQTLKDNLAKAQHNMKKQADLHRREQKFEVGDWVFVRLQPYRQQSIAQRSSHKLSKRYFGPFKVLKQVGQVAYRVDLPEGSRIHPVFHVSLLRRCYGDQIQGSLPREAMLTEVPAVSSVGILGSRVQKRGSSFVTEILVHWSGLPEETATWEELVAFRRSFLGFDLEDKVVFEGGGDDMNPSSTAEGIINKRVRVADEEPAKTTKINTNKHQMAYQNTRPKRHKYKPRHLNECADAGDGAGGGADDGAAAGADDGARR